MSDDRADLVDCIDHVMRVARGSRTQTRRIRWIFERCRCALEGEDWKAVDLEHPRMVLRGLPPHLVAELENLHALSDACALNPNGAEVLAFLAALQKWHTKEASLRFAPDRPAN